MIYYYSYETELGSITFMEEDGALLAISTRRSNEGICQETALIKEAHRQFDEYLKGERKTFRLPLNPKGTDFQKRVWKALCEIPYGETRSYKQISEAIGNPKAVRAVGMANNRNPLLIVVPCHRVIGANGKLVGYAAGIDKKELLLRLENRVVATNSSETPFTPVITT
jgi:methylated-DNA-[protein]-cysteine S-methyltransferase